ncbi:retrovirus-related pol polyprotein from transposon TNT 1-94 [Tanacetum coccineum]
MSTAQTHEQNSFVKRRNHTLVEVARTMLSAAKVPLFFSAEAIATSCFTQNRSLIIPRYEKTLITSSMAENRLLSSFTFLALFATSSEMVKIYLCRMASDHVSPDPVPQLKMSNELDFLFSLMFNELLNGTTPVVSKSSAVDAADAPDKCQHQNTTHTSTTTVVADPPPLNIQIIPQTTNQSPTQELTVNSSKNIIQAETNHENA